MDNKNETIGNIKKLLLKEKDMQKIKELELKRTMISRELEELKRTSQDYMKIKFLQKERLKCNNYLAQIRYKIKHKTECQDK